MFTVNSNSVSYLKLAADGRQTNRNKISQESTKHLICFPLHQLQWSFAHPRWKAGPQNCCISPWPRSGMRRPAMASRSFWRGRTWQLKSTPWGTKVCVNPWKWRRGHHQQSMAKLNVSKVLEESVWFFLGVYGASCTRMKWQARSMMISSGGTTDSYMIDPQNMFWAR